METRKILILAPHTDDGELGCGAMISRYCSEGKEVHYGAFSLCSGSLPNELAQDTLEKECRAATAILGIKSSHLHISDHEVRNFYSVRQQLLDTLIELNKEIRPDLVFIPSAGDIHQDHHVIHMEAKRAFKYVSLLGYELPWNNYHFQPQFFVTSSAAHMDKKISALKTYASQSHRPYMAEQFIRSLARVRGVQCNTEYAEAFEVYRMIS